MSDERSEVQPKCRAVLYFSGEHLDPDELIALFPIEPTRVRRLGDAMARPTSGQPTPTAKRGLCSYSTTDMVLPSDINAHVAALLALVEPRAAEIRKLVLERELKCEIVCFFSDPQERKRWTLNESNERLAKSFTIPVVGEEPNGPLFLIDNASIP